MTPVPLKVKIRPEPAVMVNGFVAAALKTISLTSVLAESGTPVVVHRLNVAVSPDEFGTVAGVQLKILDSGRGVCDSIVNN